MEEAQRALSDVLACVGKSASSLPREMLTTGIRAAILSGDKTHAAELGRAGRAHWRSFIGLAVQSSEALAFSGELAGEFYRGIKLTGESTHPLLHGLAYNLHYPVLVALSERLHALISSSADSSSSANSSEPVSTLCDVVDALKTSRGWAFATPLFGEERARPTLVEGGAELRARLGAVDARTLADALGLVRGSAGEAAREGSGKEGTLAKEDREALRLLEGVLGRMGRALSRSQGEEEEEVEVPDGERVERGVREL